jgi:four helix bundle protein
VGGCKPYPRETTRMRDHTSLVAWQVGQELAIEVYKISTLHWRPPARSAFDQLARASLSVHLNISEGYVWRPRQRWAYHLRVALGSAVETTDAIRFLGAVGVLPREEVDRLEQLSRRAQALILSLLKRAEG